MSANMRMNRRQLLTAAGQLGILASLGGLGARALAAPAPAATMQVFIDNLVAQGMAPGAVLAIGEGSAAPQFLRAGKLAFDSSFAVDADTLWRIYSQTKPVTGIAALMLVGEGQLKLDQPVADFIPAFGKMRVLIDPDRGLDARPATRTMTIRHLLTHTAGLGYTTSLNKGPLVDEYLRLGLRAGRQSRNENQPSDVSSLAEFAERLATLPLIAEPGAKWSYSCSLDLLGRVIEIAAGMPFDHFLEQRLFTPLGMRSTYFAVPQSERNRLVTNYQLDDKTLTELDPGATSIYLDPPPVPYGGSGLVSSARDYDRFLAMLANRGTLDGVTILSPETAALGMSNLLPPGAAMPVWKKMGLPAGAGFGAGGSVQLSGPGKGSFGWLGAAGSIGRANPITRRRASGFINVFGSFALAEKMSATMTW
jgi:CubicO group peptidase (beta-lactamase class C family)